MFFIQKRNKKVENVSETTDHLAVRSVVGVARLHAADHVTDRGALVRHRDDVTSGGERGRVVVEVADADDDRYGGAEHGDGRVGRDADEMVLGPALAIQHARRRDPPAQLVDPERVARLTASARRQREPETVERRPVSVGGGHVTDLGARGLVLGDDETKDGGREARRLVVDVDYVDDDVSQ